MLAYRRCAMVDDIHRLADPVSLAGMLQRGRGLGWIRAEQHADTGRAVLVGVLSEDPRWDRQVEARSEYYATLTVALRLTARDLVGAVEPADEDAADLLQDI